ncbi:hypothetical protein [Pedobacter sp. MC2016-05]|uniref:hypothetical protein n=1 Tax=Pedobacter sp. MC2016-05 TaxID=2994474 RepID=UPI002247BC8B|nr:hypothetical protein [Pedobacter sp. MC2016-05]
MAIEGVNTAIPGRISLTYKYDASLKKAMPVSKKLIVVNGKAIERGTIGGMEGSDYIIILTPDEGVQKYGKIGALGLIEAKGPKITLIGIPSPHLPARHHHINRMMLFNINHKYFFKYYCCEVCLAINFKLAIAS